MASIGWSLSFNFHTLHFSNVPFNSFGGHVNLLCHLLNGHFGISTYYLPIFYPSFYPSFSLIIWIISPLLRWTGGQSGLLPGPTYRVYKHEQVHWTYCSGQDGRILPEGHIPSGEERPDQAGWTFWVMKPPQWINFHIFVNIIIDMLKKMLFLWV